MGSAKEVAGQASVETALDSRNKFFLPPLLQIKGLSLEKNSGDLLRKKSIAAFSSAPPLVINGQPLKIVKHFLSRNVTVTEKILPVYNAKMALRSNV